MHFPITFGFGLLVAPNDFPALSQHVAIRRSLLRCKIAPVRTIGTGLVLRFGGLGAWEALVLCGLSGWLAEAFVVPRFSHAPLLLI